MDRLVFRERHSSDEIIPIFHIKYGLFKPKTKNKIRGMAIDRSFELQESINIVPDPKFDEFNEFRQTKVTLA